MENRVNGQALRKLNRYDPYLWFYPYMKMPLAILLVALFIIPYVNLIMFIVACTQWVLYELNRAIYDENLEKVPNIFENMVYHPAL
jgi:hypothetical protein